MDTIYSKLSRLEELFVQLVEHDILKSEDQHKSMEEIFSMLETRQSELRNPGMRQNFVSEVNFQTNLPSEFDNSRQRSFRKPERDNPRYPEHGMNS